MTAVRTAIDLLDADVPVSGAPCFVGTELPWFGASIGGVPLVGRRGRTKLLSQPGPVSTAPRSTIARNLDKPFPPA